MGKKLIKIKDTAIAYCFFQVIFLLGTTLLFGTRFEINDDPGISAVLAVSDNSFSPFQHYFLSKTLSFFYANYALPWWTIFSILTIIVSAVFLACIFYHVVQKQYRVLLLIINTSAIYLFCLSDINFTRTAGVAAIAAVLLFINMLEEGRKHWVIKLLFSLLLTIISVSIRYESTLLIAGFGCVTVFAKYISEWKFSAQYLIGYIKKYYAYLFLLIFIVLYPLTNNLLLDVDEKEFLQYNSHRVTVTDYSYNDINESSNMFDELPITYSDYLAYKNWVNEDFDTFSYENVELIAKSLSNRQTAPSLLVLQNDLLALIIMIFVLISVLAILINPKRNIRIVVIHWLFLCIVAIYLSITGRLPSRVFETMLLYCILAVCYTGFCRDKNIKTIEKATLKQRIIITFSVLILATSSLTALIKTVEANQEYDRVGNFYPYLDYINNDKDNIYFATTSFSRHNRFDIGYVYPGNDWLSNLFYLGGWGSRMPYMVDRLEDIEIDNPFKALYEKDNVLCITNDYVTSLLLENHNPDITYSKVDDIGIYDIVKYTAPLDASYEELLGVNYSIEIIEDEDPTDSYTHLVTGQIDDANIKYLYINIEDDERVYSYQLRIKDDLSFIAYLSDAPMEYNGYSLIAKLNDGTNSYYSVKN